MTEFPALRDALVDAGRRRRRRRRRAFGAIAPVLVVAAAIAAPLALPASDPERERTAQPPPTGTIERAFGIFRRAQVAGDVVPAEALHGVVDRARSRLVGRSGQARVYAVPATVNGKPNLCLVQVGLPSSTAGCTPLDGSAIGEDFAPDLGTGDLFALLVPDGSRDVALTRIDGTTTRPPLRDNGVVVREQVTVGLASWAGASGTRHTKRNAYLAGAPGRPQTCPPALDPLPDDAVERATGVALIAAGLYPSAEATVAGAARPISTPCSNGVTARSIEVRLETRTSANRSQRRLLLGMIAGQMTVYYVLD